MRRCPPLLPRSRCSQRNDRCHTPCISTSLDLEAGNIPIAKNRNLGNLCSWWLVSLSANAPVTIAKSFSVTIISSLRMVTVIESQGQMNFTCEIFIVNRDSRPLTKGYLGSLVPLGIWNVVETNVGVVLACLPSMRPLLRILLGQKLERMTLDGSHPRGLSVHSRFSSIK